MADAIGLVVLEAVGAIAGVPVKKTAGDKSGVARVSLSISFSRSGLWVLVRATCLFLPLTTIAPGAAHHWINLLSLRSRYVRIRNASFPAGICFSVAKSEDVRMGSMGFSGAQRSYARLADADSIDVAVERFSPEQYVGAIELHMEFQKKKFITKERYDVGALSKAFAETFTKQVFGLGQTFVFKFAQQDEPMFKCTVKSMTAVRLGFGLGRGVGAVPTQMLCRAAPTSVRHPYRVFLAIVVAGSTVFRSRGRWWPAPTTPPLRGLVSPSAW